MSESPKTIDQAIAELHKAQIAYGHLVHDDVAQQVQTVIDGAMNRLHIEWDEATTVPYALMKEERTKLEELLPQLIPLIGE